jgi:RNA recognition motif. (a.k.a. RRM, RBD, or RNP domain)
MEKVHLLRPEWRVIPLTATEYAQRSGALETQISDFEGQIHVCVYYDSRNSNLDERAIASSLRNLTETFGDVKTFRALSSGQNNLCEFHVEFHDTRDAENAVSTLHGISIEVGVGNFIALFYR